MRLIPAGKNLGKPFLLQLSPAHQQQRTNQPAYHPCQKTIRCKIKIDQSCLRASLAARLQHQAHARMARSSALVARAATESPKIVFPDQQRTRPIKRRNIQGLRYPIHKAFAQRRRPAIIQHCIAIASGQRAEAGMEIISHLCHPAHRNISGKDRVECPLPIRQAQAALHLHMHYLPGGMHPAVRAPSANDRCALLADTLHSRFQHSLHRWFSFWRLALEPMIGRAIIFNEQSHFHRCKRQAEQAAKAAI